MKTNKELVQEARADLVGKWKEVVMISLIYLVVVLAISLLTQFSIFIELLAMFAVAPLYVGFYRYFLDVKAGIVGDYNILFRWFQNGYLRVVLTYFMMCVYVLLWTCLFIVPGIIMSIAYAQTLFILASDDKITPSAALRKSQNMMRGYKMKYFLFNLRFIGWALLAILTAGVGFVWLLPYMSTAQAGFYNDLKANYVEEDTTCCC